MIELLRQISGVSVKYAIYAKFMGKKRSHSSVSESNSRARTLKLSTRSSQ